MSGPGQSGPTPRNRLLASLPRDDLARLLVRLEPVDLPLRQVLVGADREIDAVYFPETCMISMIAALDDGHAAEVGLLGPEGMVGIPLLLGSDRSPTEAMCQGSGIALRLSASAFREEVDRSPALRTTLLRYAQAFLSR